MQTSKWVPFLFVLGVAMLLVGHGFPAAAQEPPVAWVARYNGPGNRDDFARAVAVDGSGNVYVTGSSIGIGTSYDYTTVKYDANGNELWVARYNGPGNGSDSARAVAVDSSGNVYVTGSSIGVGTGSDYATVKYDPEGNELWVARYNGPADAADAAVGLRVEDAGSVLVTGTSAGSGTGRDYATVKYDAEGNELWVARYDGPGNGEDNAAALAVDGAGNVYVTGDSLGSGTGLSDYATVKYDADGNELWVARYNGPGNGEDNATALAVDDSGSLYVTGYVYLGDTGCVKGGIRNIGYATLKYDAQGNLLWLARYERPGSEDHFATALAVDASGNVYVTGHSFPGPFAGMNYVTVKYDTEGNLLWDRRYGGGFTFASALAIDGWGNVYVTGSTGTDTSSNYATVKYDAEGNQLWADRYRDGVGSALAVDDSGNVYVTGYSFSDGPFGQPSDYWTIKYAAE
jgi:hypothetical protein